MERYRRRVQAHWFPIVRRYWEEHYGSACRACGVKDHRVIEWHHIRQDPSNKAIGTMCMQAVNKRNHDRLMHELSKCEPLCRNCHRIETLAQMGYGEILLGPL